MGNPFCIPGATKDRPGPLKPWAEPFHAALYVAVDNTEQAFQEFQRKAVTWNLASQGEPVLASGPDGCGKTALLHRCAYELQSAYKAKGGRVAIVDRSSRRLDGETILGRAGDLVAAILRQLRTMTTLFPQSVVLPTVAAGADEQSLRFAMEDLSAQLSSAAVPMALVVVPPKIELPAELHRLIEIISQPGIVLLMETGGVGVKELADDLSVDAYGRKILALTVGPLAVEHGLDFVEARMKSMTEASGQPSFDKESVQKYMRLRSEGLKVTIRELERVCIGLFEDAAHSSANVIDYEAFAKYYLRRAQGIG